MTETDMPTGGSTRQPFLSVKDGAAVTSSRTVAAVFRKRHGHVLRAVDELLKSGSPKLGSQFFQEVTVWDDQANREVRMFEMTRDGFTLLGMGFTGRDALEWKLEFIEAFNIMEAELRRLSERAEDQARLAQLEADMASIKNNLDPSRVVTGISVRQLLDDAKAKPQGRRRLNHRIGRMLANLAKDEAKAFRPQPRQRCPKTSGLPW